MPPYFNRKDDISETDVRHPHSRSEKELYTQRNRDE